MFLSEDENFTDFHNADMLVWCLDDISFGSWTDGPDKDGSRVSSLVLNVPEVITVLYCILGNVKDNKFHCFTPAVLPNIVHTYVLLQSYGWTTYMNCMAVPYYKHEKLLCDFISEELLKFP